MDGIVSGEKVDAVLVHADTLSLCMDGQGTMKAFGNSEFKLPGIL